MTYKPEEWKNRGNQHFKRREFVEALRCYTHAIRLSPRNAVYYSNRGICLYEQGQYEEAIIDTMKALQLSPEKPKPDPASAPEELNRWLRNMGFRHKNLLRLGKSEFYSGRYNDALASLRHAESMDKVARSIPTKKEETTPSSPHPSFTLDDEAKRILGSAKVYAGWKKPLRGKDERADRVPDLWKLPPLRPSRLTDTSEYYFVGHDAAVSVLAGDPYDMTDEDCDEEMQSLRAGVRRLLGDEEESRIILAELSREELGSLAFFHGGVGDARHVLISLIDIHRQVCEASLSTDKKSQILQELRAHFVLNDVKAHILAKDTLVLYLLVKLSKYSYQEIHTGGEGQHLAILLLYLSFGILVPPAIHQMILETIDELLQDKDSPPECLSPFAVYDLKTWKALVEAYKEWRFEPYEISPKNAVATYFIKGDQATQLMHGDLFWGENAHPRLKEAMDEKKGRLLAHLDQLSDAELELYPGLEGATLEEKRRILREVMEKNFEESPLAAPGLDGTLHRCGGEEQWIVTSKCIPLPPGVVLPQRGDGNSGGEEQKDDDDDVLKAGRAYLSGIQRWSDYVASQRKASQGAPKAGTAGKKKRPRKGAASGPAKESSSGEEKHQTETGGRMATGEGDKKNPLARPTDPKKLISEAKKAAKDATSKWRVNPVVLDKKWMKRHGFRADFCPYETASSLYSMWWMRSPPRPSIRGLFDWIAYFYSKAATALRVLGIEHNALCLEVRLGDMHQVMRQISVDEARDRAFLSFPVEFDRCFLSNVPDYTSLLSTFVYMVPHLKKGPTSFISSNVLANTGLWINLEEYVHSGTLLPSLDHCRQFLGVEFLAGDLWDHDIRWAPVLEDDGVGSDEEEDHKPLYSSSLAREELQLWLQRLLLLISFPTYKDPTPCREYSPMNLALFFQLLDFLVQERDVPKHWLASIIASFIDDVMHTSAKPPIETPMPVTTHEDQWANRTTSRRRYPMSIMLLELRTLTSLWMYGQGCGIPSISPSKNLPEPSTIRRFRFKRLQYAFMVETGLSPFYRLNTLTLGLCFVRFSCDEQRLDFDRRLRAILLNDGSADSKFPRPPCHVYTVFEWSSAPCLSVSFLMSEEEFLRLRHEKYEAFLFQTDCWEPITESEELANAVMDPLGPLPETGVKYAASTKVEVGS